MFYRQVSLEVFQNSQNALSIKKLQNRCFPVNFSNFFWNTFFYRTSPDDCLWIFYVPSLTMTGFWTNTFLTHRQGLSIEIVGLGLIQFRLNLTKLTNFMGTKFTCLLLCGKLLQENPIILHETKGKSFHIHCIYLMFCWRLCISRKSGKHSPYFNVLKAVLALNPLMPGVH